MKVRVDPERLKIFNPKVWFDNSCVQVRLWGTRNDWNLKVFTSRDVIYSVPFPRGVLSLEEVRFALR